MVSVRSLHWGALLPLVVLALSTSVPAATATPLPKSTSFQAEAQNPALDHKPTPDLGAAASLLNPFPERPLVSFNKHGKFRISVFSDTHMLDSADSPGNETNVQRATAEAVRNYLAEDRPDFVWHNGDVVSGEAAHSPADVDNAVRQLFGPVVDAQVPFAATLGNHGNDRYSTHESIVDTINAFAGRFSFTQKAPASIGAGPHGVATFFVPVYDSPQARRGSKPALLLWAFDSRSGRTNDASLASIEDWVHPRTGEWITNVTSVMKQAWGQHLPPSLVFTHIPIKAFEDAKLGAKTRDKVGGVVSELPHNFSRPDAEHVYPGLNDEEVNYQGGEYTDKFGPYKGQEKAFVQALLRATGNSRIHAITSGHDHGDDWCAPSNIRYGGGQTVPLCYTKHTGLGGYTDYSWNYGSRIFDFDLDSVSDSVRTHIRLTTGEEVFPVTLSEEWAKAANAKKQPR